MAQRDDVWKNVTIDMALQKIGTATSDVEVAIWSRIAYHIEVGNVVEVSDTGKIKLIPIVPGTVEADAPDMPINKLPL